MNDLAERYLLDGSLAPAEAAELARALRAGDPAVREALAFASLLGQALEPAGDEAFLRGLDERIRAEAAPTAFLRRVDRSLEDRPSALLHLPSRRSGRHRRRSRPGVLLWGLAAAACLACAVAWWSLEATPVTPAALSHAAPSPVVAIIASVEGSVAVWRDGGTRPAEVGAELGAGEAVRAGADARIVLRLAEGSELTLSDAGECAVHASPGGMRCDLRGGTVAVVASHQEPGRRLTITTRNAVASVVGTRFRLSDAEGRTELRVYEGAVELRRNADGANLRVGASQRAEVAADRPFQVEPFYAPPLRITSGGIYRGAWESTDPEVPAVEVATREEVTIADAWLRGCGTLVHAGEGARLTVRNCRAEGATPTARGRSQGRFVEAEQPASLTIERNDVRGTIGIRLSGPDAGTIAIRRNRIRDLDSRPSDGQGGRLPGDDIHAGFVWMEGLHGLRGAEIAWNEVIGEPGRSQVLHQISLTTTSGVAGQPILIHDNLLRGVYPADPVRDAFNGGGIVIGWGGGKTLAEAPGWVRVVDNQLIATGTFAVAIFGGHDIEVTGNRAVASGLLPDGGRIRSQDSAFRLWDAAGDRRLDPPTFFANAVRGNVVGWMRWTGPDTAELAHFGMPDAGPDSTANQELPYPVTRADEDAEWWRWQQKLRDNAIVIGAGLDAH